MNLNHGILPTLMPPRPYFPEPRPYFLERARNFERAARSAPGISSDVRGPRQILIAVRVPRQFLIAVRGPRHVLIATVTPFISQTRILQVRAQILPPSAMISEKRAMFSKPQRQQSVVPFSTLSLHACFSTFDSW